MKKNKKYFKIFICNVILIILIFIGFELYSYNVFIKYTSHSHRLPYLCTSFDILSKYKFRYPPKRYLKYDAKYAKKPILLLGCSYTYGHHLEENDTFAALLNKYTNRHVYNFGEIAGDPFISLIQLKNEHKYKLISKEPEYIVYTYMFHHIGRLKSRLYYKHYRKYGYIENQKYNIFDNFYTYLFFRNESLYKKLRSDREVFYEKELFYKIIQDMNNEAKLLFPNSKFVLLIYSDIQKDLSEQFYHNMSSETKINELFQTMYSPEFKKRIEDMGIIVITTEELLGRKMNKKSDRLENDYIGPHPSAKIWKEIVPELIKKLKL